MASTFTYVIRTHPSSFQEDESYTSQTCGKCGRLHKKLGGNKVFKCPHKGCGYTVHRDLNGGQGLGWLGLHLSTLDTFATSRSALLRSLSRTSDSLFLPIPTTLSCAGRNIYIKVVSKKTAAAGATTA